MKKDVFKGLIFWSVAGLTLMFLSMASVSTAEEYSVEDVLNLAQQRAERIKISEEDIFIAQMERDKAQSALIPKLSAYGGYIKYSEDKYTLGNTVIQASSAYSYGLRIDQSYSLAGREFKLYDIAKENIEKSRLDNRTVREDYLIGVASSFYDALKAQRYVEIARSNLERLQKHRNAAEVRLKVGEVTKTALLRAEAELSGARTDLIRSENAFKLAKAVLARLVGITSDFGLRDRETSAEEIEMASKGLAGLITEGQTNRSEIASAALQQRLSAEQVKVAETSYYPSLSFEAVYNRAGMNPESLSLVKESIYGGIKINFPIYEGGLRRAEVREARAKERQSLLLVEDARKAVAVDIEKVYLEYTTHKDSLKSNKDQVIFARDNFNAVSKQFEYGLANSIDVMDANNLLVTSEQRLSETLYNYNLSLLRIKRAIGRDILGKR